MTASMHLRGRFALAASLFAVTLAAGCAAPADDDLEPTSTAASAAVGRYDGSYALAPTTLTVDFALTVTPAGGEARTYPLTRSVALEHGALPPTTFDADKAWWRAQVEGWTFLPPARIARAVSAIDDAYDDALESLNARLAALPDTMTVARTNALFGTATFTGPAHPPPGDTSSCYYVSATGDFALARMFGVHALPAGKAYAYAAGSTRLFGTLARGASKLVVGMTAGASVAEVGSLRASVTATLEVATTRR